MRLARFLLLPLFVLPAAAQVDSAQKKRTDLPADDAIWGYGFIGGPYPEGGPKPVAAPILPQEWIVVPVGASWSSGEWITRASDSTGRAPTAGEAIAGDSARTWETREGQPVANAALAFTRVVCDTDEVRMARLTGAGLLLVNGTGFIGDSERRSDRGVPVALHAGANELYVYDIRGPFELELWSPRSRAVLGSWDVCWPENPELDSDITYPVFNASLSQLSCLHIHYGHARLVRSNCEPKLSDWRDGGSILPLGLRMGGSYFLGCDDCDATSSDEPVIAPVCVYGNGDEDADRQLLRGPGITSTSHGVAGPAGRSRAALEGTVLSKLGTQALVVYGAATSLERARFDMELVWYRSRVALDWMPARGLANKDLRPIVYGNAETNSAWSQVVRNDGGVQVCNGRVFLEGREIAGADICGWFLIHTSARGDALAIADTGTRGARLGYLVQPLFAKSEGLDYCFWDSHGENGAPRVIASGTFAKPKEDASRR